MKEFGKGYIYSNNKTDGGQAENFSKCFDALNFRFLFRGSDAIKSIPVTLTEMHLRRVESLV